LPFSSGVEVLLSTRRAKALDFGHTGFASDPSPFSSSMKPLINNALFSLTGVAVE
jgi:hypothetical protein